MIVGIWASTPQATFSAGTISNDMPVAMLSALFLFWWIRARQTGTMGYELLAASALALGVLCKITVLLVWLPVLGIEFIAAIQAKRWRRLLILTIVPAVLAGWSVLRGMSLHELPIDPARIVAPGDGLAEYLFSWLRIFLRSFFAGALSSIGILGVSSIHLPGWVYGIYFGMAAAILAVFRDAGARKHAASRLTYWLPYVAGLVGMTALGMHWFRESGHVLVGRLLYSYVPGILLFAGMGFSIKLTLRRRLCVQRGNGRSPDLHCCLRSRLCRSPMVTRCWRD